MRKSRQREVKSDLPKVTQQVCWDFYLGLSGSKAHVHIHRDGREKRKLREKLHRVEKSELRSPLSVSHWLQPPSPTACLMMWCSCHQDTETETVSSAFSQASPTWWAKVSVGKLSSKFIVKFIKCL